MNRVPLLAVAEVGTGWPLVAYRLASAVTTASEAGGGVPKARGW